MRVGERQAGLIVVVIIVMIVMIVMIVAVVAVVAIVVVVVIIIVIVIAIGLAVVVRGSRRVAVNVVFEDAAGGRVDFVSARGWARARPGSRRSKRCAPLRRTSPS